jgi:hypothetical protein
MRLTAGLTLAVGHWMADCTAIVGFWGAVLAVQSSIYRPLATPAH